MHRRDVLKALATIPLAGMLSSCRDRRNEEKPPETLEIHLDGAFAVVIQEFDNNSILAFSPRPQPADIQHKLYLNGDRKAVELGKANEFHLSQEGLEEKRGERNKVEINRGLDDFFFRTENWRVGDSLLTIKLPAPKRITFSGQRIPVTFKSDGRHAWMPTNHILEYDVRNSASIKLDCNGLEVKCASSSDSYPGVTRYFFEIGPEQPMPHDKSLEHAIKFYNYILQQSFPDLVEKFSLFDPYGERNNNQPGINKPRAAVANPLLMSAGFQYGTQSSHLRQISYIIDCESAGLVAGTRTPPK